MFQKCTPLAMSKIPQNMPEKSLSMLLSIDWLLGTTIANYGLSMMDLQCS